MYINVAYVDDENPNIEDQSVPLRINNCGYYRLHTTPVIETPHPEGRNDYQLLYIAHGKGHFYFKNTGEETIVQKGNVVLFRPGEPQVYYYYAADRTEVYWVHFTGSQVEKFLNHYELPKNKNVFYAGLSSDYPWLYNRMIQELQLRRANHEELLKMLLHCVFLIINRYLQKGHKTDGDMMSEIERASRYFKENFNREISIEQYAEEHLMTSNWFIKCFKNVMKITPRKYILSLRIAAAKGYLEGSNKNVTEISNAVGYDNALYFSRVFKKYTGLSPLEYRKNFKKFHSRNNL